jgi:hypothetical protein
VIDLFELQDRYSLLCSKLLMSESSERDLEDAQKKQNKVGAAESDPKTTGPAENLREEAAKAVDEEEEAAEPA